MEQLSGMIHEILETKNTEGHSLVVENECNPIPNNEIRRLFEPFYRPDFSRSRESGGNGLGLYIVDMLLCSMNISYSFAAMKMPKGMRFTIHIHAEFNHEKQNK